MWRALLISLLTLPHSIYILLLLRRVDKLEFELDFLKRHLYRRPDRLIEWKEDGCPPTS